MEDHPRATPAIRRTADPLRRMKGQTEITLCNILRQQTDLGAGTLLTTSSADAYYSPLSLQMLDEAVGRLVGFPVFGFAKKPFQLLAIRIAWDAGQELLLPSRGVQVDLPRSLGGFLVFAIGSTAHLLMRSPPI